MAREVTVKRKEKKQPKVVMPDGSVSKSRFEEPEEERESRKALRRKTLDPMTASLGCSGYFYKMRWPWLVRDDYGVEIPMEVSRFYAEKNVALDLSPSEEDAQFCQLKEELCSAHGIRYFRIDTAEQFEQMKETLEHS